MKMTFLILKKTGMLTSDFWILFIASIKGFCYPNQNSCQMSTKFILKPKKRREKEGRDHRKEKRREQGNVTRATMQSNQKNWSSVHGLAGAEEC